MTTRRSMDKLSVVLTGRDLDYVQDALTMYIDYLRDGDDDEKEKAKRVENTYDDITKQIKWS